MATKTLSLLAVVAIAVLATASTVTARPCKTLFYFSTTAYYPIVSNPNSPNPRYYALIFTTTRPFHNPQPNNYVLTSSESESESESDLPLKLLSSSTVSGSIKDRTKDIVSVAGALLFGVSCGALTAAIIYFLWALCSPRSYDFEDILSSSDDDNDDDDDDVAAIKKKLGGYVAIPVKEVADDDDAKKPAAKEVP